MVILSGAAERQFGPGIDREMRLLISLPDIHTIFCVVATDTCFWIMDPA